MKRGMKHMFNRRLVAFIGSVVMLSGLASSVSAEGEAFPVLEVEPVFGDATYQGDTQRDPLPSLAWMLEDEKRPAAPVRALPYREPERSSWAVAFDNDILALTGKDQDYTYGFNVTYTGRNAKHGWYSLDRPLGWLDRAFGFDHLSSVGVNKHSIEAGLFGFTPNEIETSVPLYDDRPYASLVYWSNSRERLDVQNRVAWKSTLSVGALGLGLVGDLQNGVHSVLGGNRARGWSHEISEGGEPTARYTVARQSHVGTLFNNVEVKSTVQGSVGYLTEASWSLSVRGGRYQTAWFSFNPDLVSYGEKSSYTNSGLAVDESYFWGGISLKARAYNAFLQGQFRNSEVTYQRGELRSMLVEAWLGYTVAFREGYRISYVLRGHSSEIKHGAGDRNLVWGGVILARSFR